MTLREGIQAERQIDERILELAKPSLTCLERLFTL